MVLHRSRTWRKAAAVAIAVYAVGTVLFILMARFTADGWRHRSPGDALFLLAYQQPLFRIWEFFVGCALGMMFLDRPAFLHNRVVVNVLLVLGFIPSALIMYGSLHDYPSLARVNVSYPLFTPGFALVVLCLASGVSFLEGLLSHRWLILLGEASYSLYLLHWIPALAMSRFYPDGVGATTGVGIIAVCVVASIVTYRFVEYPARRAILRQTGERPKAQEVQLIPS